MRRYLNESHRRISEACQREVEEMTKHPMTAKQKEEQMLRNKRRYLSDSHRRACEVLQESVDRMKLHPMTREEMKAQCDRNRAQAEAAQRRASAPDTETNLP